MPEFFVTPRLLRGTIRLAIGQCTRRELRATLFRYGWQEPDISNYLDMVKRAMREIGKGVK